MSDQLPFDARNAKDFEENTKKIEEALALIQEDRRQKPTKASLARLTGLSRNTLYNRSLASCPPEYIGKPDAAEHGWPYKALANIKKLRRQPSSEERSAASREPTAEEKLAALERQLQKSRHVASAWFHRALKIKEERDVARRESQMLRKQIAERESSHRDEVERLRKQLKNSVKAVK